MNALGLKAYLMAITENEERYRKGKPNLMFSHSNLQHSKNDDDVLFFELAQLLSENEYSTFVIRKHSRFQSFPLHYHDYVELNYMYSGSCRQIINQKMYTLKEGQVLLMDSNTIHTIEPLGENDILINIILAKKYLTAHFFNRFSSDSVLLRFFVDAITDGIDHERFLLFHSEHAERLHLFLNELLCEWYSPSIVHKDILENLFSLVISELVIAYKNDYGNSESQNSKVVPMLRYIEQNYETCTLEEMARFFALSPNYLSALLKKHVGLSFKELVLQQRLWAAATLLANSTISVADIVEKVGCQNVSYFYKKFYEEYNVSPGDYRKRGLSNENSFISKEP